MARFRYAQNGQSFQEFSGNNLQTDREIQMIIRKLRLLPAALNKTDFEKILAESAVVAKQNMQKFAPQSKAAHKIKDGGKTYKRVQPGNLKKSIQIFKAAKNSRTILVGPIVAKDSKVFKAEGVKKVTRRHRAFYYRFVNYGTVYQSATWFIEKAREASRSGVKMKLKAGAKKYLSKEIAKLF